MSRAREISAVATLETVLSEARSLSRGDRRELMRELARLDLIELCKDIEANPVDPLPISDEELDEIVHEARGEMLRARGL